MNRSRRTLASLFLVLVTALCGCGQKGPLTREPGPPEPEDYLVRFTDGACQPGLTRQPGGAQALLVLCETPHASSMAVVFPDAPDTVTPLAGRLWAEAPWAERATGVAWTRDGNALFVAGWLAPDGSGGLYRLDLAQRLAERVFPAVAPATDVASHYVRILRIDLEAGTLEAALFRHHPRGLDAAVETVTLPLR